MMTYSRTYYQLTVTFPERYATRLLFSAIFILKPGGVYLQHEGSIKA